MDKQSQLVDINHASLLELLQLPGIKTAVADRIMAGRPYTQLDDLLQVRGIKANHLNKLRPLISIMPVTDAVYSVSRPPETDALHLDTTVLSHELPPFVSDQSEPAQEVVLVKEVKHSEQQESSPLDSTESDSLDQNASRFSFNFETPVKLRQLANELSQKMRTRMNASTPLSQAEAMVWGVGLALLVLILAAVITLGILGGINGGLSYIPSGKFGELQGQVSQIDTRIKQLQQDTTSLQDRMNTLESLSGRVGAVEKETQELKGQLSNHTAEIQKLSEQTKQVQDQISQLQERNNTFEKFFNSLKALLDDVFPVTAK